MNVLSKDLRQRILNYALTHPVRLTARIFQVSPNTVHLLKKLWYETGSIEPRESKAVLLMRSRPKANYTCKCCCGRTWT